MKAAMRGEKKRGLTTGTVKRVRFLSLCLAWILGQVGCSHVSPRPLPEDVGAQLGPVALASARFAPSTEIRVPAQVHSRRSWPEAELWGTEIKRNNKEFTFTVTRRLLS